MPLGCIHSHVLTAPAHTPPTPSRRRPLVTASGLRPRLSTTPRRPNSLEDHRLNTSAIQRLT
eukprot:5532398-Pyramimonas_sp.AAC.1